MDYPDGVVLSTEMMEYEKLADFAVFSALHPNGHKVETGTDQMVWVYASDSDRSVTLEECQRFYDSLYED